MAFDREPRTDGKVLSIVEPARGLRYTGGMMSVADTLRRRTREQVRNMTASARIELALRLGDDDLHRFQVASGLGRQMALGRLRAQRQLGRVPSACAEGRP